MTMVPVNDPPVASDDTGTTPEDTLLTGNVLGNDTDIDGGVLSVTQFVVDGITYTRGQTAFIASVGALTVHANGPVATYTVSDGRVVPIPRH